MNKILKPVVITSWIERYRTVIALFCGGIYPPLDMVEAWLVDGGDDIQLQDWVCCNTTVLWAQAISILDAAQVMADQPEEGVGHLDKHGISRGI